MEPSYTYRARITRVVDADTFEVEVDAGFRIKACLPLRLAHVDAAEHTTTLGRSATSYVQTLLGALPAAVVVRTVKDIDKYGRYLADVFVGEELLAQGLIDHGFAYSYEGGKKTPLG